ncbi:MAG: hypothetical protein ABI874_08560 [Chloroflexota bacterium]
MLNELRNRPIQIIAGSAFVVGLLFGLIVLGWWLWPVTWTDSNPTALAAKYKTDYVQMVADSFAIDQDDFLARTRLIGFDNTELSKLASDVRSDPQRKDAQKLRVQRLAERLAVATASTPSPGSTITPPTAATTAGGPPWGLIFGLLGLLFIVGGGAGIAYLWYSRRAQTAAVATPVPLRARDRGMPTAPVVPHERDLAPTPMMPTTAPTVPTIEADMGEPPLGGFLTTYKVGDDGYDTSFSIEVPTGEFLGECGVGISEVVGEGPQKVTAFEVWLFDKNDIKTVTKVLMSDYAYHNDAIRKKLQARGDAVLATTGQDIILETETMRVRAVVTDMAYGSGGTPQSFFSKLTMELAPTIKNRVPA